MQKREYRVLTLIGTRYTREHTAILELGGNSWPLAKRNLTGPQSLSSSARFQIRKSNRKND
jgi:hypothetical protein